MFRRAIISFKTRLKRFCIAFYPFKGEPCIPFIILGHPRTGTTLLHTYLNSHWQIHSFGDYIGMDIDDKMETGRITSEEFINNLLKTGYPPFLRAVGFKFFYNYSKTRRGPEIFEILRNMEDLRIIHVKRKDKFRTAISYELANQTNLWSFDNNEPAVQLNPASVRDRLKDLYSWELEFDRLTADKKVHQLVYEDLIREPQKELAKVQLFLGVSPRKLTSLLKQQHPDLSRFITNYQRLSDELKKVNEMH